MTNIKLMRVKKKMQANKKENLSKHIEQIASKQTPSKSIYINKYYLNNIPTTPLLSTPFGKYTAQKSTTDQWSNTNHTTVKHVSLLTITMESKDIAKIRASSDNTLIHTNQASASIDRRGHGDRDIYFGICKSFNKIRIDLGRISNDGIGVNAPRTFRIIRPQITSLNSGTETRRIGFGRNSDGNIPPRNIGSVKLFDIGTSDFSDRSMVCHGAAKSENENPEGNRFFKKSGRENHFEVENLRAQKFCNFLSHQFQSHQHRL